MTSPTGRQRPILSPLITISPGVPPVNHRTQAPARSMRVAIYARYSSDAQSERSIDDQIRICRARAEREGWEVGEVYADYALSGASAARPRFQQLVTDARSGRFGLVLAEALDRISRDQEHIAGFYKQMIPSALCFDACDPIEISQRSDASFLFEEAVPGFAAGVDDGAGSLEEAS